MQVDPVLVEDSRYILACPSDDMQSDGYVRAHTQPVTVHLPRPSSFMAARQMLSAFLLIPVPVHSCHGIAINLAQVVTKCDILDAGVGQVRGVEAVILDLPPNGLRERTLDGRSDLHLDKVALTLIIRQHGNASAEPYGADLWTGSMEDCNLKGS